MRADDYQKCHYCGLSGFGKLETVLSKCGTGEVSDMETWIIYKCPETMCGKYTAIVAVPMMTVKRRMGVERDEDGKWEEDTEGEEVPSS